MSWTKQRGENRNPKHIYYVSLLNSQQWQGVNGLRARTLREHPLCQLCEQDGIIRSSRDVHHLRPVEDVGRYYRPGEVLPEDVKAAMRHRCFDPTNVIALCRDCHQQIHRDMKSHQWQQLNTMPKDEQSQDEREANDWFERISGGQAKAKPETRKGITKTKYGWVTPEEFKAKQQSEIDDWLNKVQGHDDSGTEGTPAVDAPAKD